MGPSRGTMDSFFKAAFYALRSLFSSASCLTFSGCFDACALDKSTNSLSFNPFLRPETCTGVTDLEQKGLLIMDIEK